MGDGFRKEPTSPEIPGYLAQLPAAARDHSGDATHHLLHSVYTGAISGEPRIGTEYLLFACADVPCAVALKALREVRPSLPPVVPLPFSPDWLIGIFPLRTQLLALVDPASLLLGRSGDHAASWPGPERQRGSLYERRVTTPLLNPLFPTTALLVGEGEGVLAWAVTEVGDIVVIPDEQILSSSSVAIPMPEKYVMGLYAPSSGERRYVILNVEQVLADMLMGLVERERSDG
ncbi:MAG: chemotaxis protein CheW [Ktedonobacterales bacterium]